MQVGYFLSSNSIEHNGEMEFKMYYNYKLMQIYSKLSWFNLKNI
jgi:hypothetical protein